MNNNIPFFNPFQGFQSIEETKNNYEKLVNKLERIEKNMRILENRVNKLENQNNKSIIPDEPTDMYMI